LQSKEESDPLPLELSSHDFIQILISLNACFQGPHKVKYGKDSIVTAKDIIIATGSVPFVPKGIEVDGNWHLAFGFRS